MTDMPDEIWVAKFGDEFGCVESKYAEKDKDFRYIPADHPALVEVERVLEIAFREFNAIRARDGAPQHIDWYQGRPLQTSSCTHEYWSESTEALHKALTKLQQLRGRG